LWQKQDTAHLLTKAADQEEGVDAGAAQRAEEEEAHPEGEVQQNEGERRHGQKCLSLHVFHNWGQWYDQFLRFLADLGESENKEQVILIFLYQLL
jgi:hypothetical protein